MSLAPDPIGPIGPIGGRSGNAVDVGASSMSKRLQPPTLVEVKSILLTNL